MQQVNLYLDEFRQSEVPYSFAIIGIITGYCVVICCFISIGLVSYKWVEKNQLTELEKAAIDWQEQLNIAERLYPEPEVDAGLIKTLSRFEEQKVKNDRVLSYLGGKNLTTNSISFSDYLAVLTKVQEKGVWLKKVSISDSGNAIRLEGYVLQAKALPKYLEKLSKNRVMSGMSFKIFNLKTNNNLIEFIVSTHLEEVGFEALLENTQK